MRIGVPKETAAGEHRVALVPEVITRLHGKGLEILVQSGAGTGALLSDDAYRKAGATIADEPLLVWRSRVVVVIPPPRAEQIAGLGPNSVLVGFLAPLSSPATIRALADAKVTALAMEAIPRISRAPSMDRP